MFALWNQINNKVGKCKQTGIVSTEFDSTILDINFGLSDYKIFNKLKEIQKQIYYIENLNLYCMKSEEES